MSCDLRPKADKEASELLVKLTRSSNVDDVAGNRVQRCDALTRKALDLGTEPKEKA
jgi:hypothetical protein